MFQKVHCTTPFIESEIISLLSSCFQHSFLKYMAIDGENHKARFGLSVACIGNLNLDGKTRDVPNGIEDMAVGAPYDGADHKGAVYIYLGMSNPDEVTKWDYAQRIFAKEVYSGLSTFGWSISGGMDLDGNEYPDLLVGAYESSNAVYLRSAPVVHLISKVLHHFPT